MRFVLLILFFSYNTSYSSVLKQALDLNRLQTKKNEIAYSLGFYSSSQLQNKLDIFNSGKLEAINDEFNKSLSRPVVASATVLIKGRLGEQDISYQREYFVIANFHNPIFPSFNLTQYRDDRLSFYNKKRYQSFKMSSNISIVNRKYQTVEYRLGSIINNKIEYNKDAGAQHEFIRLAGSASQGLGNNEFLISRWRGIDIGDNPINEYELRVGYLKSFDIKNLKGNIKFNLSSVYDSVVDWIHILKLSNPYFRAQIEYISKAEINKRLGVYYNGFSINIEQEFYHSILIGNKQALVNKIFFNYSRPLNL